MDNKITLAEVPVCGAVVSKVPYTVEGQVDGTDFLLVIDKSDIQILTRNSGSVTFGDVPGNPHLGYEFREVFDPKCSVEDYLLRFHNQFCESKAAKEKFKELLLSNRIAQTPIVESDVGYAAYSTSDSSYIDFLNVQIELNARGAEWTQILVRRKEALEGFVGEPLLLGTYRIRNATNSYYFDMAGNLVHQEDF